jgi:hypothetical protein
VTASDADRDLLERLIPDGDDPWEQSREGLDDCCHYCASQEHDWSSTGSVYFHEKDCVWMEAMEYLGRSWGGFNQHRRKDASDG